MSDSSGHLTDAVIVEDEVQFTLVELSRVCHADSEFLVALVHEGVLVPRGGEPRTWLFGGSSLKRAAVALRLTRDLEINVAGAAVVLDLLDEIDLLKAQLRNRPCSSA